MTTENEDKPVGTDNPTGKKKITSDPDMDSSAEKPIEGYKILGGNLLAFAIYTLIALSTGGDGGVAALGIAGFQFVICTVLAIASKRAVWFLSGVLVLIIGFGTCVSTFSLGSMH